MLDEDVIAAIERKLQLAKDQKIGVIERAARRYEKYWKDYSELMEKNKTAEQMSNGTDLTILIKVRKLKADKAMPTTLAPLRQLFDQIKDRRPLTLKDYLYDNCKPHSIVDEFILRRESGGGGTLQAAAGLGVDGIDDDVGDNVVDEALQHAML